MIVEGLVTQHTPREIAQAIGVSRKTVYEEIAQPETQALIREWLRPHHAEIRGLIPKAIKAVDAGLKTFYMADRLRAVKVLGTVMSWAQGKADAEGQGNFNRKFRGTMEELLIVYRDLTHGEREPPAAPALEGGTTTVGGA